MADFDNIGRYLGGYYATVAGTFNAAFVSDLSYTLAQTYVPGGDQVAAGLSVLATGASTLSTLYSTTEIYNKYAAWRAGE